VEGLEEGSERQHHSEGSMRIGDVLICETGKDGGPESRVDGFWLFRHKKLFSIALLRFSRGSREAYHSHAFNAVSWLLTGRLREQVLTKTGFDWFVYEPSIRPIKTPRERTHKVYGLAESNWVLTFRGPWVDTWREFVDGEKVTLTHNRVRVANENSTREAA
jgi:hypothetical protein